MTLAQRLFLLVVVALLPALAIQAYNELDLRRSREAEVRELALRQAELAASELSPDPGRRAQPAHGRGRGARGAGPGRRAVRRLPRHPAAAGLACTLDCGPRPRGQGGLPQFPRTARAAAGGPSLLPGGAEVGRLRGRRLHDRQRAAAARPAPGPAGARRCRRHRRRGGGDARPALAGRAAGPPGPAAGRLGHDRRPARHDPGPRAPAGAVRRHPDPAAVPPSRDRPRSRHRGDREPGRHAAYPGLRPERPAPSPLCERRPLGRGGLRRGRPGDRTGLRLDRGRVRAGPPAGLPRRPAFPGPARGPAPGGGRPLAQWRLRRPHGPRGLAGRVRRPRGRIRRDGAGDRAPPGGAGGDHGRPAPERGALPPHRPRQQRGGLGMGSCPRPGLLGRQSEHRDRSSAGTASSR